jgi:hypothetical protein
LVRLNYYYATEAATVGVPQVSVKNVVAGGTKRHNTAGAVPKLEYGLVVSVPPEMFVLEPGVATPADTHVVTNVNVVLPAFTAAVTRIKSPVYGAVVEFNCHIVVAAAPAVKLYHPVVVKFGLGVPDPPERVKPV